MVSIKMMNGLEFNYWRKVAYIQICPSCWVSKLMILISVFGEYCHSIGKIIYQLEMNCTQTRRENMYGEGTLACPRS